MTENLFNIPRGQLLRWQRGDVITARKLNENVDATNALLGGVRPARQIVGVAGGDGGVIESTTRTPRLMRLQAIDADHIICRTYDYDPDTRQYTEGTDNVFVAKPWELRRTPFDGQMWNGVAYAYQTHVQRTATYGVVVRNEVITPPYVPGGLILCQPTAEWQSGLILDGVSVNMIELSARAWSVAYAL